MISKLLLIALGIAIAIYARKSRPAQNQNGKLLHDQSRLGSEPETLKVATFNIQTGKSLEGKRDLNRSAQAMANNHLVGVQEVYAPKLLNLLGIGRGQTSRLAANGNYAWLFCPTRRRWMREHRGNAVLSKLPFLSWRVEMLPDRSGKSFRNMTVAEFIWQGETVHFINTQLNTRQGREEQLDVILREFAKYPRAILVGDFNSRSDTPLLARALKNVEITDAISEAGLDLENPDRIDWIFTKGFNVLKGEMLDKGISDHPYYSVTLSIKDPSQRVKLD